MDNFGEISFARDATDWNDLNSKNEVFYLAIAGPNAYRYRGADLGIFVSRCAALYRQHRRSATVRLAQPLRCAAVGERHLRGWTAGSAFTPDWKTRLPVCVIAGVGRRSFSSTCGEAENAARRRRTNASRSFSGTSTSRPRAASHHAISTVRCCANLGDPDEVAPCVARQPAGRPPAK
jgi:hypothetical protein